MNLQKVLLSLALGSGAAFSTGSMRQQKTTLRMSVAVGEQFPAGALSKIGVAGKPAVLYFYGADEAPSCTKQCKNLVSRCSSCTPSTRRRRIRLTG